MSLGSGLQVRVLTALADGPGTAEELAVELSLPSNNVRDLLGQLVKKGSVARVGSLPLPGVPRTLFGLPEHAPQGSEEAAKLSTARVLPNA